MANSNLAVTAAKNDHTAGTYVTHIDVDGLILPIRIDSDMPSDAIAAVYMPDCKKGWLEGDGLRLTDEPEQSTRKKRKALQGSVGFLIENVGQNHAYISGITGGPAARTVNAVIANTTGNPVPTKEVTA